MLSDSNQYQRCRIKLSPLTDSDSAGVHRSFFGFLGPISKTQRLNLEFSEQWESLFNFVCGRQASHPWVTLEFLAKNAAFSKEVRQGWGQMRLCFLVLQQLLYQWLNNWRSSKTIQWDLKKKKTKQEIQNTCVKMCSGKPNHYIVACVLDFCS